MSGALALGGVGVGVVACSSDSGGGTPPGTDSGTNPDNFVAGSDAGADNYVAPGTEGGTDAAMGADCESDPKLHAPKPDAGNIYCPFTADSGTIYCNGPAQHCCETPIGAPAGTGSSCETIGATFNDGGTCPVTGSTDWQCNSPQDCTGGDVCCISATGLPSPSSAMCPNDFKAHGVTGTNCFAAAACPGGTFQICEATTDCTGGMTCQPFRAQGVQLGVCM